VATEAECAETGLCALCTSDGKVLKLLEGNAQGEPVRHAIAETYVWDGRGGARRFFQDTQALLKNTPVVVYDTTGKLLGMVTRSQEMLRAAYDNEGRLLCGAAVALNSDAKGDLDFDRISAHIGRLFAAGVDAIAVSTAHGYSQRVYEAIRYLSKQFPQIPLIAGNITSAAGARFLIEAGAKILKVGQGPGSICTTRVVAGVGIPQLTALHLVATEARKHNVSILADGGLTKSGDIVKALTLADAVMCGGLLAGCPEAPGECIEHNGKQYKAYRGMGSLSAMRAGSAARYGHDASTLKLIAEGVEAIKEMAPPVRDVLFNLVGGLRSGMGYLGAKGLTALRANARYIRVTNAGMRESYPHDVVLRDYRG
jgi:IMP dehydrogenase